MDFTNVKLFMNPLRHDMSTNVKYFSTGAGCYSNSKLFQNDLDCISNNILKLSTKFPNLNGGFDNDFHEQRMIPSIISVINSLPLSNICVNLTNELMNATTNMTTFNSTTGMVISHMNNLTDLADNFELRKSLSPKRFYNNQQLQMKVKNMKKSPNLMFYRNLIEEIAADRKMVSKILPPRNGCEEFNGVESISTPNFVIIQNTNHNKFIEYEIRFHEAKRKKLPHKIFQKCTDNAAKFAEPMNILELENGNHNQVSHSNTYNSKSSTISDPLEDDDFEMINLNNEVTCNTEQLVNDESDEDDDSFIEFDDISDDDGSSDDSDNDDNITEVNGCLKDNYVPNITRTRLLSDCDSEDSFIIFAEDNDDDTNDQNRMELIQEEDEKSGDDENDIVPQAEDVTDYCCSSPHIKKIQVWEDLMERSIEKKVQFKPDSELCIIHPMIQWSYAYQNARKGVWEEAARDRSRFQFRLRCLSDILKPILANEHRNKIYIERFQDNNNT